MDPALKKRLIGASVLIVLAIIFLPMLFDGSEPVRSDSVQLDIPVPPQRDFETRVVPLDQPVPSTGMAEAIGVPDAVDSSGQDHSLTTAPLGVDEPVAAIAAPPAPRVDAVSGETVGGNAAANTASQPARSPATTTTSVAPAPVAAEAPAPVAAVPVAAPVAASGRFMVNIGSYANAANASQLESALRAAGLAVRSESVNVDGKPARRLRLGPYATRALAENARIKAKGVRSDIPASVIEVDDSPAADAPVRAAARSGASVFAVQVAVLSDAAKANVQRDNLRAAGFAAFVEKLDTDKGTVHRLRIGPEADRADAEKIRAAVKQRFGFDAIIVDYP
jgi:DedD protein